MREASDERRDTVDEYLGKLLAAIRTDGLEPDTGRQPDSVGPTPGADPASRPPAGEQAPTLRVGTRVRDSWKLTSMLGQGGFGLVFAARHLKLDREDALKFLHPHLADDDELRRRFRQEAMVMAKLRGDHLVQVHDCDEYQGLPFFAMERLSGESLEERLEREGPLSMEAFHHIADGILRGLAEIHAHGVLHRDIKPANIFLVEDTDHVKLLDFGLARTSLHMTAHGTLMGTPMYMAPELLLSSDAEALESTDIYSAGVVLYQMLTGRLPYSPGDGASLIDLLRHLVSGDLEPPEVTRTGISGELEAVIRQSIDRDASHRPGSARAFAERLRTLRPDVAETARSSDAVPPRPTRRARKASLRRYLFMGTAVLVLAAILGGILLSNNQVRVAIGLRPVVPAKFHYPLEDWFAETGLEPTPTRITWSQQVAADGSLLIRPHSEYLEHLENERVVVGNIDRDELDQAPELSVVFTNETDHVVTVSEVSLEVLSARVIREPILSARFMGRLMIENYGWSDTYGALLDLSIAPARTCDRELASPLFAHLDLRSKKYKGNYSVEITREAMIALGYYYLDREELWEREGLHVGDTLRACLFGDLQYRTSPEGPERRFGFVIPALLRVTLWSPPQPQRSQVQSLTAPSETYAIELTKEAPIGLTTKEGDGASPQTATMSITVAHVVEPGETDHFVLRLTTDESAEYDMDVVVRDIHGEQLQRQRVLISLFRAQTRG